MIFENSIEFAEQSADVRLRLMSTSFERTPPMLTREQYMNCRANIDNALNSSDFVILSMFDTGLPSFQLLIVKKDENDAGVSIFDDDVSFLKRRFKSDGIPVKFTRVRSCVRSALCHNTAFEAVEFHSTC